MTDCSCDLGHWCGNHDDCHLCGRDLPGVDQTEGPALCSTCERTAKAGGRMLANARRYPDPEN